MCLALPRRRVRHPRRRARPGLPAPRERDRPVPGGRAAVRPLLGAPRAAQPRRGEDGQVAGQRDRPAVHRGARDGHPPVELRYYLAAPHYRSRIDYSEEALREAAAAYRRIEGFVQRAAEVVGAGAPADRGAGRSSPRRWTTTSTRRRRSPSCTTPSGRATPRWPRRRRDRRARGARPTSGRCSGALGLDPLDPRGAAPSAAASSSRWSTRWWRSRWSSGRRPATRKDWAAADAVRDQLKDGRSQVEDTPTRSTLDGRRA